MVSEQDVKYLQRCLELAEEAVEAGDEAFGSLLVDGHGNIIKEDRNRVNTIDATYHPEIALAQWAAKNMDVQARAQAVMYTSGEHCPMCSAGHALAGLGRIVYASSAKQLNDWLQEMGVPNDSPVNTLSIREIVPHIPVDGPVAGLDEQVKALHKRVFLAQ